MRRALIAFAAFAVLAAPAASRAEEDAAAPAEAAAPAGESAAAPAGESAASHEEAGEEHGLKLRLGLGLGYGIPMGEEVKNHALSHLYAGEIPIELEVSYKFTHAISAGVYVGYGIGLVSSKVVEGVASSDHIDSIASWRFGVQGEYEFGKVGPALPFAALRVGYVTETLELAHDLGTDKVAGWEYLTLIAGADFEVAKSLAVGPFVSLAFGQYTNEENHSIPSAERGLHEWLTIGVRGAFTL